MFVILQDEEEDLLDETRDAGKILQTLMMSGGCGMHSSDWSVIISWFYLKKPVFSGLS